MADITDLFKTKQSPYEQFNAMYPKMKPEHHFSNQWNIALDDMIGGLYNFGIGLVQQKMENDAYKKSQELQDFMENPYIYKPPPIQEGKITIDPDLTPSIDVKDFPKEIKTEDIPPNNNPPTDNNGTLNNGNPPNTTPTSKNIIPVTFELDNNNQGDNQNEQNFRLQNGTMTPQQKNNGTPPPLNYNSQSTGQGGNTAGLPDPEDNVYPYIQGLNVFEDMTPKKPSTMNNDFNNPPPKTLPNNNETPPPIARELDLSIMNDPNWLKKYYGIMSKGMNNPFFQPYAELSNSLFYQPDYKPYVDESGTMVMTDQKSGRTMTVKQFERLTDWTMGSPQIFYDGKNGKQYTMVPYYNKTTGATKWTKLEGPFTEADKPVHKSGTGTRIPNLGFTPKTPYGDIETRFLKLEGGKDLMKKIANHSVKLYKQYYATKGLYNDDNVPHPFDQIRNEKVYQDYVNQIRKEWKTLGFSQQPTDSEIEDIISRILGEMFDRVEGGESWETPYGKYLAGIFYGNIKGETYKKKKKK